MSAAPFSLNEDLRRLRDDGYFVQIVGGFLVMREVPYVNAQQEVKMGTLISSLCMSGNITQKPEPHTIHFDGDFPCTSQGAPILAIAHTSSLSDLGIVGCKSTAAVYFSPFSCPISRYWAAKSSKTIRAGADFRFRRPKPDRLLAELLTWVMG